ncbi:hypothetical protein J8J27_32430, partial [Mycobacterium tuberculosis]|nr:hypothetical protein [Mycobacterium tuberculosis]
SQPLGDALEESSLAAAIVTPGGRVLHANPAFGRIASLRLEKGHLRADTAADTAALMSLIVSAARPGLDGSGPDYVAIGRRPG